MKNKKILMLCLTYVLIPLFLLAQTAFIKLHHGSAKAFFDRPLENVKEEIIANIENINAKFLEVQSETFLHCAAMNGTPEILKFILDNGADIEATDNSSYTPLYVAAMMGRNDSVKILLEYGANPNCNYFYKPIHTGFTGYVNALLYGLRNISKSKNDSIKNLPEEKSSKQRSIKESCFKKCSAEEYGAEEYGCIIKLLWPVTELKENQLEIWKKEFYSRLKSELTKPEIDKEWDKFLSLINN